VSEIADEIAEQYATIRAWTEAAVSVDAKVACFDLLVDTDRRLAAWMRRTLRAEYRVKQWWLTVMRPVLEVGEDPRPVVEDLRLRDPRAYALLRWHLPS
jgi:hypothetical protein